MEFTTVDEYIARQPEEVRARLEEIRQLIRQTAPEATEVISYQMPAYKFHGMLAFFAAFKNHYGLYTAPAVLEEFKEQIRAYKFSKATLRFPYDKPLPAELVTQIIRFAMSHNMSRKMAKDEKKKKK